MERKPSRKKMIKSFLGNDFSEIKKDKSHPLMRFIDDISSSEYPYFRIYLYSIKHSRLT